jgi:hypothetical protein
MTEVEVEQGRRVEEHRRWRGSQLPRPMQEGVHVLCWSAAWFARRGMLLFPLLKPDADEERC